jgi:hypothetical protein
MKEQRYYSGEEIHIGDRVTYGGTPGVILFVIDRGEFSPEFPAEHWSGCRTGFMIRSKSMGLVMLDRSDEVLEFISRAAPSA